MSGPSALAALKAGKLKSLGAQELDGMVKLSRSRVGQDQLARLQGISDLPMIILSELLALHITEDTHAQDHRLAVKGSLPGVASHQSYPEETDWLRQS